MVQIAEHLRIKRKFFIIHELRRTPDPNGRAYQRFTVFRSYAPGGMLRSGRDHCMVSSDGDIFHFTAEQAQKRVALLKAAGWVDERDPGYDA